MYPYGMAVSTSTQFINNLATVSERTGYCKNIGPNEDVGFYSGFEAWGFHYCAQWATAGPHAYVPSPAYPGPYGIECWAQLPAGVSATPPTPPSINGYHVGHSDLSQGVTDDMRLAVCSRAGGDIMPNHQDYTQGVVMATAICCMPRFDASRQCNTHQADHSRLSWSNPSAIMTPNPTFANSWIGFFCSVVFGHENHECYSFLP